MTTDSKTNDQVQDSNKTAAAAEPLVEQPKSVPATSLGVPDVAQQHNAAQGQSAQSAGLPLKLSQDHTHASVDYEAGQTIALDPAEYRWALDNKIGVAGNKDDIGK